MSRRTSVASSVFEPKEGLEGEITCNLCLNIYKEPKILSCGHIYCSDPCLVGLIKDGNISCPECRKLTVLKNENVTLLPTAFHINRLKDLHCSMTQDEQLSSIPDEVSKTCGTHQGQELAIYCDTCMEVLCRDCLIATTNHQGHFYEYLAKSAVRHRKTLRELIEPAKILQKPLFQALIKTEETKTDISTQQTIISKDIDIEVDKLVQQLTEKRRDLHDKLGAITTQKMTNVCAREQMLSKAHIELSESVCLVEDAVDKMGDLDFLIRLKRLKEQIQLITSKAEQMPLKQVAFADTHLMTATQDALTMGNKQFYITSGNQGVGSKCTFQKESLRNAWVGTELKFLIKVCDAKGIDCKEEQTISVELLCIRDMNLTLLSASLVKAGQYLVQFSPTKRGRHLLAIKVNGAHINGSPLDVYFNIAPQKLDVPASFIGKLRQPTGIACSNGYLFVCESEGEQIVMYDSNFYRIRAVARDLNKPTGIAIDQKSNIYVTTLGDNQLHKLNPEGEHVLATTGGREKKDRALENPHGVCVIKNQVIACDSNHCKIKIYDTDLNMLQNIGKMGTKINQFLIPIDVIGDNDAIYIVESDNHRVQVFDHSMKPIRYFGGQGKQPGQLLKPAALATYGNYIYISDYGNNRVSVFTKHGQFVTTFGEGYVSGPEGIAIDQDGYVFVCSHRKQIFVF